MSKPESIKLIAMETLTVEISRAMQRAAESNLDNDQIKAAIEILTNLLD